MSHILAVLQPQLYSRSYKPLSRKKRAPESGPPVLPDWAIQIGRLKDGLRLTQQALAAKMNVSQPTVSDWLAGRKEPKPEIYFRMAAIWPKAETVPFLLKRAADLSGAYHAPGYERFMRDLIEEKSGPLGRALQTPGNEQMLSPQKKPATSTRHAKFGHLSNEPVEIPLLKDAAAAGTPRQVQQDEIEEMLPLPGSLCPHPDQIVCIKVQGDSMSPILDDGYIVAVDTAQKDRIRLYNQMVAARDPEGGVTIKWLRKVGKDEMLLAQHTSKRHQPVLLTREGEDGGGWEIVGKVLWWIGMPG